MGDKSEFGLGIVSRMGVVIVIVVEDNCSSDSNSLRMFSGEAMVQWEAPSLGPT
jgi:hypothetical protein